MRSGRVPVVTATIVVASLVAASLAGCGGSTVPLGEQTPRPYHFGTPRLLAELGASFSNDNPTLTGDLLEIYFTSLRDGVSNDVWWAHRASTGAPFSGVAAVTAANTPSFETSSAIASDGLTLWVGSDRPGGAGDLDIWMLTRATRAGDWSTPVNLVSLNSPTRDVPRPPGQHGLVMPLASERDDPTMTLYRTYLSRRPDDSAGATFATPQPIPELVFATTSTVDAFLSDDGLTMFFSSSAPMGVGDLFVAWRRSTAQPFSVYEPLDELNTSGDERDPWLSSDGQTLYFSSDRDGILNVYEVAATRP